MKYLHTKSGRRSRTVTRQSNSVGSHSCATTSSDCAKYSSSALSSDYRLCTFATPCENALSGSFTMHGKPRFDTI